MYIPPPFAEHDPGTLIDLIRSHPLGMVSWISGGRIETTPLPFLVDDAPGGELRLQAHLPRVNPLARESVVEAVVTFLGPDAYISPGWYPTKRQHGRAVPTWNYAMVVVRGPGRIIPAGDWVEDQMRRLTTRHEAGRPDPWSIDDAPRDYVDALIASLVGLEIVATALEGKWKVSQNQPEINRRGVIAGLHSRGEKADLAMAALVEAFARS